MGIVFRQSIKTTIITFSGALLGAVVVYLSTRYIPRQGYGFIRNLTNLAVVAGQILLVGLPYTLSVYIHKYNEADSRKKAIVSLSFIVPVVLVGVATIFYYLFKNQIVHLFQPADIPFIARYYGWLPVFTLLFSMQIMLEQYLFSQMKVAKTSFIREIVLRLLNIILIILFAAGLIFFDTLTAGVILIYIVSIIILYIFASHTGNFKFSLRLFVFSKAETKEIIHFTWYHALLITSYNLIGFLDAIMLAPLSKNGLSDVAVYTNAVFVMSVLQIPYKAMVQSTFPVLTQAFRDNDTGKVKDVFSRSSINIFIASVAVAAIICCNLSNAAALMQKSYAAIIPLVLIMLIGRMADIATGMNDQVLSLSRHYKFSFYLSLVLIVLMIILNIILIPRYGIYGAAWSTSLALTAYNAGKYIFVWWKLGLQPFSRHTIAVLLSGCIAALAGYIIPYTANPFVDTFLRTAAIGIVYTVMLLIFKPSADLRIFFQNIMKNRRFF